MNRPGDENLLDRDHEDVSSLLEDALGQRLGSHNCVRSFAGEFGGDPADPALLNFGAEPSVLNEDLTLPSARGSSPFAAPGVSPVTLRAAKAAIDLSDGKIVDISVSNGIVTYTQLGKDTNKGHEGPIYIVSQFVGANYTNNYAYPVGKRDTQKWNGPGKPLGDLTASNITPDYDTSGRRLPVGPNTPSTVYYPGSHPVLASVGGAVLGGLLLGPFGLVLGGGIGYLLGR